MYTCIICVAEKTWFKNPENCSIIDFILKNCPESFQNRAVFEIGLSDFYKLTVPARSHQTILSRYSRSQMFFKISVLKNY